MRGTERYHMYRKKGNSKNKFREINIRRQGRRIDKMTRTTRKKKGVALEDMRKDPTLQE